MTSSDNGSQQNIPAIRLSAPEQRHHASAELLHQLRINSVLIEESARLLCISSSDPLAVIRTATRATNASAHIANAMAKVTEAEQRQRRIIEVVQTSRPALPHSNSTLDAARLTSVQEKLLLASEAAAVKEIEAEEVQACLERFPQEDAPLPEVPEPSENETTPPA